MISITSAKPNDFDDFFILLKQLFTKEKFSEKIIKKIYLENIKAKDSIELLLKKNNKTIGYAAVKFRNDFQSQGRIGYLSELIIDESQRGKGFGTKFLKEVMKLSKDKGCKEIQFPSTFKRKKAHKFYMTQGFNKTAYFFWKEL
jgi:GNAT superfamily N-acetyltransferase